MLWSCYDGLVRITVGNRDYVCPSLSAGDDSGLALEAAVRHALLLGSIKHYRNTVAL